MTFNVWPSDLLMDMEKYGFADKLEVAKQCIYIFLTFFLCYIYIYKQFITSTGTC